MQVEHTPSPSVEVAEPVRSLVVKLRSVTKRVLASPIRAASTARGDAAVPRPTPAAASGVHAAKGAEAGAPLEPRAQPLVQEVSQGPVLLADGSLLMTASQEWLNAVTMILPVSLALRRVGACATSPPLLTVGSGAYIVAAAIVMHFPFSVMYHLSCALRPHAHPVLGNGWCAADLVAIHLAGSLMALATTGSVVWFCVCTLFNMVFAWRTTRWLGTRTERRLGRVLCAASYIVPMCAQDVWACALAALGFFATALFFALNPRLGGWGHALSHVALVPLALGVLRGAEGVHAPGAELATAALRPLQC